MSKATVAAMMCEELGSLIMKQAKLGADLDKQCVTVSCPAFKIIYVPTGSEQIAKMELNG